MPVDKNMKLICPGCGLVASAESWENDQACRETLLIISMLPGPVVKYALGYLSLFRPRKQALSWAKALRLAKELQQLVSLGYIKAQGKPDRNCPPYVWAKAIEQMIEQRGILQLPMKSHGYLKTIAWGLADQADAQDERKKDSSRQNNRTRSAGTYADLGLDPLEKARREFDKKHQTGNDKSNGEVEFKNVLKGVDNGATK